MDLEQLLLCKLAEECSEVIKLCMKAQQFGLESISPETGKTNKELLHGELNDILGVVGALNLHGDFSYLPNEEESSNKVDKINKYLKISQELGRVKE